jgi:crotonobetainyl-CoA:carnitine CoA-transferase CaiB-like acyl-CoA transferase
MGLRLDQVDALYAEIARSLVSRTAEEWLRRLADAHVPCSRVNGLRDLFDEEHLAAVGFWSTLDHETEGRLRVPAPFGAFDGKALPPRPAPRLGQHSIEVLRNAGYADEEIGALLARRATRCETRDPAAGDTATMRPTE